MPSLRLLSARARERAFTLIELLVVILIIGILIAVAAPSFLGQQDKAHDSSVKQSLALSYKALKADTIKEGSGQGNFAAAADVEAAVRASEPQLGTAFQDAPVASASALSGGQLAACASSTPAQLRVVGVSKSGAAFLLQASANGEYRVARGDCDGFSETAKGGSGGGGPAAETYDQAVAADTPYAYYKLDEPTPVNGVTDTANARPLAANAAGSYTSVAGAMNGSQGVNITGNAFLYSPAPYPGQNGSYTTNFTMEVWVKPASATTAPGQHGTFIGNGGTPGYWSGAFVWQNSSDADKLQSMQADAVNSYDFPECDGAFQPNTWHHVVYRRDGGTGTLWLDGQQCASGTHALNMSQGRFTLGALASHGFYYSGALDNAAFYDKPLSDARIAAHYAAAANGS